MIQNKVQQLRTLIYEAIPEGTVVPAHTAEGHRYLVPALNQTYVSVTTKLQHLKEPGIQEWKMNRSLEYVFANFKNFTDQNIMAEIEKATQVPADQFQDAGDIGREIHDLRQAYYEAWITTGERPESIKAFIPPSVPDLRLISAGLALEKFCKDTGYIPVVTELYVYSEKLELAGTLDDIGLMPRVVRPGTQNCVLHDWYETNRPRGAWHCMRCDRKIVYDLVLSDLKSSNQFKDSYFMQVALYCDMFQKLTGLKLNRCFILKLDKTMVDYKIERMDNIPQLVRHAKNAIKGYDAIEYIKSQRKDAQKIAIRI